nr:enoyl-ACP reductase [Actinomycetales bacterium]
MTGREFDVILFGATGYVGSLVAAHLAEAAEPDLRIALAGRSLARLTDVRDGLEGAAREWDLIEAEAGNAGAMRSLASRTAVVASTVGPYFRYGKDLVRAAAEEGTHYADLTGEALFVRWTLDHVAARAEETGARIVHSCGFDSIPSDLGVFLTAQRAAADGQGTLEETTLVVRSLKGGLSGGTIDSARQQALTLRRDRRLRRILRDPYSLSPRRRDEPAAPPSDAGPASALRSLVPAERDPATGHWHGPFVMAGYNTRIVRLSNTLTEWSYGRGLRYREVTDMGSGRLAAVRAVAMGAGLGALVGGMAWAPTRALIDRMLPKPGEGPSAEQRAVGEFRMEITSTTTTGARYRTTVAADLDPGYGGTAVMLGQSALALALDAARLPAAAGVLTPATAMGHTLVDRLGDWNFTIEAERIG